MAQSLQRVRSILLDRSTHTFLWFCLPAVIVGLFFRLWLLSGYPLAIFDSDAPDFLQTAAKLLDEGRLSLHAKRTILTPALYLIAAVIPGVPTLSLIAIGQHALGLASVMLLGLLCRLWLRNWKWVIVPVTVLFAADPSVLFYGHTLMAETAYLFTTLLMAVALTLFCKRPTRLTFFVLLFAFFLQATARPEGKLFLLAGFLALPIVFWKQWPKLVRYGGVFAAFAAVTFVVNRTTQDGLLLLTSLVHMTTERETGSAPGFGTMLAPVRERLTERWQLRPAFPSSIDRREISRIAQQYLNEKFPGRDIRRKDLDDLCRRVAFETAIENLHRLPLLVFYKFQHIAHRLPGTALDEELLHHKQTHVLQSWLEQYGSVVRRLFGRPFSSSDEVLSHVARIVPAHGILWHDAMIHRIGSFQKSLALPALGPFKEREHLRGIPLPHILALLGCLLSITIAGNNRPAQGVFCLTLAAVLFIVILTAPAKPRFLFVALPFLYLYLFALADALLTILRRIPLARLIPQLRAAPLSKNSS